MLQARSKLIAENIERTARGEPPLNMVPLQLRQRADEVIE
jgi:hypothetical protein